MKYIKPNITDKQRFEWTAYWKEYTMPEKMDLIRKYILEEVLKKKDEEGVH